MRIFSLSSFVIGYIEYKFKLRNQDNAIRRLDTRTGRNGVENPYYVPLKGLGFRVSLSLLPTLTKNWRLEINTQKINIAMLYKQLVRIARIPLINAILQPCTKGILEQSNANGFKFMSDYLMLVFLFLFMQYYKIKLLQNVNAFFYRTITSYTTYSLSHLVCLVPIYETHTISSNLKTREG